MRFGMQVQTFHLSDIKIGSRLIILILAFLLWGGVGSLLAYKTLREVQISGPLYQRLIEGKDLVADILPPPKYIVESNLVAHELFLTQDPGELTDLAHRLSKLKEEYEERQAFWEKAGLERVLHETFVVKSDVAAQRFFRTAFESYLPVLKSGDRAAALRHLAGMKQDYAEHRKFIDATVKLANERNAAVEETARSTIRSNVATWIGVAGIMSVLVLVLAIAIARGITRPLGQSVKLVEAISEGDLTQRIPRGGRDEIGQLLVSIGQMQEKLRTLVGHIQRDANQLSHSAQELSTVAAKSAQATEAQSEAASGMAASVEQMSVSIDHVGENAREAQRVAQGSGEQALAGGEIVRTTAREMQVISDAVRASAESIRELGRCAEEISGIVGVIRDIAEQTNLLALNAAIEAARAGEQGRGFAVVADEVRKLAERTTQSTQQIGAMIEKVQSGTRQAVGAMETDVAHVDEGMRSAHQAGDSIVGIEDGAKRVVEVVQSIAACLTEQSAATQEIARGVERIARMAEENSASAEQTAASAGQIRDLAAALDQSVGRFRT